MPMAGLRNKVINKRLSACTWMNDKQGYLLQTVQKHILTRIRGN